MSIMDIVPSQAPFTSCSASIARSEAWRAENDRLTAEYIERGGEIRSPNQPPAVPEMKIKMDEKRKRAIQVTRRTGGSPLEMKGAASASSTGMMNIHNTPNGKLRVVVKSKSIGVFADEKSAIAARDAERLAQGMLPAMD